jgi:ubiquinone biosynthesis protein COQ9
MDQSLSDERDTGRGSGRGSGGDARARLLAATLPHVAFDGWSDAAVAAGAADAGLDPGLMRVLCPRGALDLAVDYHRAGDAAMVRALAAADLGALRFRDRIAHAVRLRLDGADREVVRRGMVLFALPQNMAVGSGLVWGTADAIWRALGDGSDDLNWYTKRLTLSAVYSATVLYWLGDTGAGSGPDSGAAATWAFLDRRIEDVMRFEKAKADFRASGLGRIMAGPLKILDHIRAPVAPPGASADVPTGASPLTPPQKGHE